MESNHPRSKPEVHSRLAGTMIPGTGVTMWGVPKNICFYGEIKSVLLAEKKKEKHLTCSYDIIKTVYIINVLINHHKE